MESTGFAVIEDRVAPVIWDVHKKILEDNLSDEVRASVDANAFQLWQLQKQPNNGIVLNRNQYPLVSGSFDTGWNKRGQLYDSPSSHSFLVGKHTRKAISGVIKSKICNYCFHFKKTMEKTLLSPTTSVSRTTTEHPEQWNLPLLLIS